jgi:hypothetical protein
MHNRAAIEALGIRVVTYLPHLWNAVLVGLGGDITTAISSDSIVCETLSCCIVCCFVDLIGRQRPESFEVDITFF